MAKKYTGDLSDEVLRDHIDHLNENFMQNVIELGSEPTTTDELLQEGETGLYGSDYYIKRGGTVIKLAGTELGGSVVVPSHTHDDIYLNKTNTTAYTPTANYHPATKKYVDDEISGISTSNPAGLISRIFINGTGGGAFDRGSYNVASVSRSGAGIYKITWTTAYSDVYYSVTSTCKDNNYIAYITNQTANDCEVRIKTVAGVATDNDVMVHAIGTSS